jgi:2-oxoglutarate ferredoxin oxidoreductase subunit alpha
MKGAVLTGEHFMSGDTACAEGGLAAGVRFFAGYPITPATEAAERMAERLPDVDGVYIQMEDELASMCAILGASWGGFKSMTSTSGPGFSLMMENLGLGIMMECPCVLVNVQRGGPSTGLPTLVGQQDMMQARWGSHGDYEIIALAPNSPQECFDMTIDAFNLSETYRTPVLVMTDEVIGHITEKVVIPPADRLKIVPRRLFTGAHKEYLPYLADEDMVPPMIEAGSGFRIHTTGLTHDERGYPAVNAVVQRKLIRRLVEKIRKNADKIIRFETEDIEGADVVIIAYGITSRVSHLVYEMAKEQGMRVGFLRLQVVWPFPEKYIEELATKVKALVVPEINMGQMVREVERCARGKAKTYHVPNGGGDVHDPEEIMAVLEEAIK